MKQSRKTRRDSRPEAWKNGRFPLNELKNRCGLMTEMLVKYTRSLWWTRIHSKMRNENDSLKANDAVFQGIYDRKYSPVRTQQLKDVNDLVLQININGGSINRPFPYIHSDRVYSGSLRLTLRLILVSFLFISFCLCPRLWNCSLSLKVKFFMSTTS